MNSDAHFWANNKLFDSKQRYSVAARGQTQVELTSLAHPTPSTHPPKNLLIWMSFSNKTKLHNFLFPCEPIKICPIVIHLTNFKSALKKIKEVSLKTDSSFGDDLDEEEMLHALEANWSQSWKKTFNLSPNPKMKF